ncbi:MAG: SHOCT domain-containing protein [Actinomycetota bacterium]|nr:SHOCT domain-containing protein [Actinomycetota bacterium]
MMEAHGWGFPWWQGLLGSILPLLFLVGIGALVLWGVLRVTERGRPPDERWSTAAARPGDSALEQARLRYARGEISREEFLQISADLGAR